MQCIIHRGTPAGAQHLLHEWHGSAVRPPFHFSFHTEKDAVLCFRAWRDAPCVIHPAAQPGKWQEELWRYDVVEFFIATPDARRYLEFNLCPNGAWWAAAFTDPRVPLPGFDAQSLHPVTRGRSTPTCWECEAAVPLAPLRNLGWQPETWRMAVSAVICREGEYTYLTTCEQTSGKPDFHHPWDWEVALLP